jgi:gluconate 2-dehydrogenase gamma chain
MSDSALDEMDRREALRRTALMLGGVLSAPTITAFLGGCDVRRVPDDQWVPRAMDQQQADLLATVTEHIIPETDTPGARAAGVHQFIDLMLAEYYPPSERQRFLAGLADLDQRARRSGGRPFLRCSADQRHALLIEMDREAFDASAGQQPFFRTLKELTLLGYCTSEVGATRELRYERIPGRYEGCIPFARVGRTWAV